MKLKSNYIWRNPSLRWNLTFKLILTEVSPSLGVRDLQSLSMGWSTNCIRIGRKFNCTICKIKGHVLSVRSIVWQRSETENVWSFVPRCFVLILKVNRRGKLRYILLSSWGTKMHVLLQPSRIGRHEHIVLHQVYFSLTTILLGLGWWKNNSVRRHLLLAYADQLSSLSGHSQLLVKLDPLPDWARKRCSPYLHIKASRLERLDQLFLILGVFCILSSCVLRRLAGCKHTCSSLHKILVRVLFLMLISLVSFLLVKSFIALGQILEPFINLEFERLHEIQLVFVHVL